ncbi:MAG: zinc-binding alcohol dehydrogenase family protein [Sulfolobales archaeon]|nr:zinc-binding alcohol dehydrogenase family protein [Sulfolobales archaeon]MDW8083084.1 zinc-binding alcohol dehydrogenase family protein [Sulfolobales archaeon]
MEIKVDGLPRRYSDLPWRENPLTVEDYPTPEAGFNQVLLKVLACGVCYTDVDIVEGRVNCKLPVVPGHQIVGRVAEVPPGLGGGVDIGDIVGVAWVGRTCGKCYYCSTSLENLCDSFAATGCQIDGGYAEYTVAYADFVYRIPRGVDYVRIAPLLCAGAVGYRALKLASLEDGMRFGLFGFGASAHIILQIVKKLFPSVEVYVFSRSLEHRKLAEELGADWTGHPSETPHKKLHRAIDFTPVGEITARALELLERGGVLVVNVIRKQTPVNLDYAKHLWLERSIKSVANVARRDVEEVLNIASKYGVETEVQIYDLEEVNRALRDLKSAKVTGSAVLRIS